MTVNLKEFLGLDVKFNQAQYRLIFDKNPKPVKVSIRTLDEMKEVLAEDPAIQMPKELYFMYRDVCSVTDTDTIREHKLRFDITIIKPDRLGKEFMKTAGHYHPKSYPELYEVVYGEALCLQQRPDETDFMKIKEVIVVKARQGEKIVCLPYFGHILINPTHKPLITANWVSSGFSSEYELYKKAKGAAYYAFEGKEGISWQKNKSYTQHPRITFLRPNDAISEFGLRTGIPMYSLVSDLTKIDFLNNPDKYSYEDVFKK